MFTRMYPLISPCVSTNPQGNPKFWASDGVHGNNPFGFMVPTAPKCRLQCPADFLALTTSDMSPGEEILKT
jgi:hypothetical protein